MNVCNNNKRFGLVHIFRRAVEWKTDVGSEQKIWNTVTHGFHRTNSLDGGAPSLEMHIEIFWGITEEGNTNRCNWRLFDCRRRLCFLALRLDKQKGLLKFMKISVSSILNTGAGHSGSTNVNFYHST
jgi:hypothetical protein